MKGLFSFKQKATFQFEKTGTFRLKKKALFSVKSLMFCSRRRPLSLQNKGALFRQKGHFSTKKVNFQRKRVFFHPVKGLCSFKQKGTFSFKYQMILFWLLQIPPPILMPIFFNIASRKVSPLSFKGII